MPLISFYRFLENKGNDRQLKRLSHDCHIMRGGGGRGGGGGGMLENFDQGTDTTGSKNVFFHSLL